MNLESTLQSYSQKTGAQFIRYDEATCIVIVSVSGGRNQSVTGTIGKGNLYNRSLIRFHSTVSTYVPGMDLKMLLEQTAHFFYARFVIRDGKIEVEAIAEADCTSGETIEEMINEVANLADQYELRLTGKDRN